MRLSYDKESNAAYLRLGEETLRPIKTQTRSMNVQAAIQKVEMPKWPSKLLTVVMVLVGAVLLYIDGAVAASLTQTNVGLSKPFRSSI